MQITADKPSTQRATTLDETDLMMSAVYEIRLHRPGGALAIVMKAAAVGDIDAKSLALAMLNGRISTAHVWRDDHLIGSVQARDLASIASTRVREATLRCSVCGEPSVSPEELPLDSGLVRYCLAHLREYDPVGAAIYDRRNDLRAIVDFLVP